MQKYCQPLSKHGWLELGQGLRLGFSDDDTWIVSGASGSFALHDYSDFYRLISLLELPYTEISQSIDAYRERENIDARFPIEALVKVGLNSISDYWAGLALKWLPDLPPEQRAEMAHELNAIVSSKWASQKNRQRAKRELKWTQLSRQSPRRSE